MDPLNTRTKLGTSGRITRYERNLFVMVAPDGIAFDVVDIRQDLRDIALLARGAPVLLVLDGRRTASITIAARRLVGSRELIDYGIIAIAGMVGGPVSRIMAGFQMRFHPPPIPTRLFTDEHAALDWLDTIPLDDPNLHP